MLNKTCPKCLSAHTKNGIFCSRACANSRIRTEDIRNAVSKKLKGRKHSEETKQKMRETISLNNLNFKNIIPKNKRPNTKCIICEKDTESKTRKTCSKECLLLRLTITSQSNDKCGGQKHTNRSKLSNINGDTYILESSFEVRLATSLNENNILWIRPTYFFYHDKRNNKRRYYPDFYLPEYDLYLDPKNDYLIKTDIDKIISCSKENNIKIYILGENFLEYNSFKELVGDNGNAPLNSVCNTDVLLLN